MPGRRFQVALSFPGEHRPRVEAIANLLGQRLGAGKVLYDKWHEAEFARPNLDIYLPNLYHDESDLVVFFFCAAYNEKEWCGLEWGAGRDLLKGMQDSRLMFLKFDSAKIAGLYSIDGFIQIDDRSDTQVADKILERLGLLPVPRPVDPAQHECSVSKLPGTDATLIGRDHELVTLEAAWTSNGNLVQIIAPGGTGKTALMTKWYKRRIGQTPIFGWSFYRLGTSENSKVSDAFFQAAVKWFKLHPKAKTADAKATALLHHLRHTRVLLILDGLESLQDHATGELRDLDLKDLLRELAAQNAGLLLCTTRVRLSDIAEDEGAIAIDLDNLTEADGARYLREKFDVDGSDVERREASRAYGNHALALTLLGTYLKRFGGDISRRFEIDDLPADDKRPGRQARQVMQSYAKLFQGKPEGDILRALGFFDRPAERDALKLVLSGPLDEQALATLREARLILSDNALVPIDCHPLVRQHFGALAQDTDPDGFRAGHSRLFDYYCKLPAKKQPDTLEELTPLFHAVGHGCDAGRHNDVLDPIYRDRINHGDGFHLSKRLSAYGTNLGLLAHFFERPWTQPVSTLSADGQSLVLSEVAFALRALGRLSDAVEPMRAGADACVKHQDLENAAICYGNLSELLLTLGRLTEAIAAARDAVQFGDRGGDAFSCLYLRTTLAHALRQSMSPESRSGEKEPLAEAVHLFDEAERIKVPRASPYPPILCSVQGYRYCDFLLSPPGSARSGGATKILNRAKVTLRIAHGNKWPLDIGLAHLTLGRAHVSGSPESLQHLDQAVATLGRAGHSEMLPLALLARGTDQDLAEVHRIASRSGMKLHLTDYHLAMARRHKSIEHLEQAEKLIQETGYHRRDPEAAALRRELVP